jgi:hypothetical protein
MPLRLSIAPALAAVWLSYGAPPAVAQEPVPTRLRMIYVSALATIAMKQEGDSLRGVEPLGQNEKCHR